MGTRSFPLGAPLLYWIDGDVWELAASFAYLTRDCRLVTVPIGFRTDFASVPRFFWRIFPRTGKYGQAAIIHDYLYVHPGTLTRAEVDRIFLEAMEDSGVEWLTRQLVYRAVRIGGGGAWETQRGEVENAR